MAERQYAHYKDLPRSSLGLMSNQLWHDDPKMLGIHLARYKFVAKMLAGKQKVAEIGCGDGWYSKLIAKEVEQLTLFDFDHHHINDIYERDKERHKIDVFHHDILTGALPRAPFDAVYSLDCMEHIHPKDENAYLRNICSSLLSNGVFIVGMPSLESQKYASEASKIGHVNCLSGADFKNLLQRYFSNVFIFGMNDETIHTGFMPMCHYLMAIAVDKK